jgi:HPt (histidine-containing phosphotransfer) domain-containing protein
MQVLDPNALEALRGLQDEGEDDLLGELIDLFLEDSPGRITGMGDAIAGEDWPALSAWAHGLKGSCGSLGAMHMAELCARLERLGRGGGSRHDAELIFRELESQYALVSEALQRERRSAH